MTTELRLTAGDVAEAAGVPVGLVRRWAEADFLPTTNAATVRNGVHRQFGPLAAVGAAFGAAAFARTRVGDRAHSPLTDNEPFAAMLARWVSTRTLGELEGAFGEGRTAAVFVGGEETFRLVGPPFQPWPPHLDLAKTAARVINKLTEIAARPGRPGPGRSRGLVGTGEEVVPLIQAEAN